jgi:hypothetical protein
VTYDQHGHGIVTWSNRQSDRLYYTLLGASGQSITPPMIQLASPAAGQKIHLGSGTFSPAYLEDPIIWRLRLPVVRK